MTEVMETMTPVKRLQLLTGQDVFEALNEALERRSGAKGFSHPWTDVKPGSQRMYNGVAKALNACAGIVECPDCGAICGPHELVEVAGAILCYYCATPTLVADDAADLPQAPSEAASDVLTVAEVADILRVEASTVRRWIRQGSLAAITLPHLNERQGYRVRRETVRRLLSTPVKPTATAHLTINSEYCWTHTGPNMGGWMCQHPDCAGTQN